MARPAPALQPAAAETDRKRNPVMDDERSPIPGSQLNIRDGERSSSSPPQADEKLTVTLHLRRPPNYGGPSAEDLLAGRASPPPDRENAAEQLGADPADVEAVRAFAHEAHLAVISENDAARVFKLQGTVSDLEHAFGTTLYNTSDAAGHSYLAYRGALSVPRKLSGIVIAVLGLDGRPVARHADR